MGSADPHQSAETDRSATFHLVVVEAGERIYLQPGERVMDVGRVGVRFHVTVMCVLPIEPEDMKPVPAQSDGTRSDRGENDA